MTIVNRINRSYALGLVGILSILSPHAFAGVAVQHSLFTESGVGFNQNTAQGNDDLSFQQFTDGTPSNASVTNQAFTGMDRTGTQQTMTFSGVNHASANYGRLRLFASGIVTNNYYNSSNPKADNGSGTFDLAHGSPDGFESLGFAGFTDTLQFGGSLQAGYKARYIFHVDGTNSGVGGLADMGVEIAGNPTESFFAFDPGFISTTWATQSYDINGITPQTVHVQFSNQFTMLNADHPDGATVSGASDFSSTLTLTAVEVLDAGGNPVSGVTATGSSGTVYSTTVPEPTTFALLLPAMLTLAGRRRKI